jgi:hypothetical protein
LCYLPLKSGRSRLEQTFRPNSTNEHKQNHKTNKATNTPQHKKERWSTGTNISAEEAIHIICMHIFSTGDDYRKKMTSPKPRLRFIGIRTNSAGARIAFWLASLVQERRPPIERSGTPLYHRKAASRKSRPLRRIEVAAAVVVAVAGGRSKQEKQRKSGPPHEEAVGLPARRKRHPQRRGDDSSGDATAAAARRHRTSAVAQQRSATGCCQF